MEAGFIETWGRGIEKICEECQNYGLKLPEYTVYSEDIMIKFETLKNTAKNTAKTGENKIEENIQDVFEYLKQYPYAKQKNVVEDLQLSRRTVERITAVLKEKMYIERIGNNRSGYWKILKNKIQDSK